MNKNAIKKFAIEARKKLIASVSDKAGMLGITEKECSEPVSRGTDFEIYKTAAGTEVTLNKKQCEQRRILVNQITERGYEAVIEEVSYTWFNRICAIRFMEINDYLPSRVRVLSSEKEGKNEPDLVTKAPDLDLDFTDREKEYIIDAKINNKLDDLFKMLLIKQCNKLHEVLPELFEKTEDYTEMLLNISYTNEDDIVYMLVNGEYGIPEADFNVTTVGANGEITGQVEIIGWLYQYYNTELKDDTFAKLKKNIKISKERIPAATQLFTPDWIVRYMVENSVGRIWIEHLRAEDNTIDERTTAEKFGWKFYLTEVEQSADVNVRLAEIRTSYMDLKPSDIKCIDPCMGSGHILIAMFDVLMDIYKSAGYSERDAAFEIVENNIHGLDIDRRAYQLSYFAIMMKGRGYNRRFFRGEKNKNPIPNVYAISESNGILKEHLKFFGSSYTNQQREAIVNQINYLLKLFYDASNYGSLLDVELCDWNELDRFLDDLAVEGQISFDSVGIEKTQKEVKRIVEIAKMLSESYSVVITNPPYKGKGDLNSKLAVFIESNYVDSKKDLFAVFIEKCSKLCRVDGYQAMITQQSWMFEDYEKLRDKCLQKQVVSCIHLGSRAFDEINGEIVKTATFVFRKSRIDDYLSIYCDNTKPNGEENKKEFYLSRKGLYYANNSRFNSIPEKIMAYWLSEKAVEIFRKFEPIKFKLNPKQGTSTGKDTVYVRYWHEVNYSRFNAHCVDIEEAHASGDLYFPLDKGGEYRKWYGNNDRVIKFDKRSYEELLLLGNHLPSRNLYFKEGLTWSKIASQISVRYDAKGFVFSSVGLKGFPTGDYRDVLGYLNSSVCKYFSRVLSPGISIVSGDIEKLPYCEITKKEELRNLVQKCIDICKKDWDEKETSWDFSVNPLVEIKNEMKEINIKVSDLDEKYQNIQRQRRQSLKELEVQINKIFIQEYGLGKEVYDNVIDRDLSVSVATSEENMRNLLSYGIGCIFGRYSLNFNGIRYAGGEWKSQTDNHLLDYDNIIPITDEEFFNDDIVTKIVSFIKLTFGEEYFEENIQYIGDKICDIQGTSRQKIRYYFMNNFYSIHCSEYQKLPIYWMFSSGKANGFKALMYVHRMDCNSIKRLRTEYLHKAQSAIEQAYAATQYALDSSTYSSEKSKLTKQITKYQKQLSEIKVYDEAVAHIASYETTLDLDNGIKENYNRYQNVELRREGQRNQTIDLLEIIK